MQKVLTKVTGMNIIKSKVKDSQIFQRLFIKIKEVQIWQILAI